MQNIIRKHQRTCKPSTRGVHKLHEKKRQAKNLHPQASQVSLKPHAMDANLPLFGLKQMERYG